MILYYSTDKHPELTKLKPKSVSVQAYAQCSKILNIEPRYIRERLRDVYVVDTDYVTDLVSTTPFPSYIRKRVILWESQFTISTSIVDWEALNLIVALSGSHNKELSYSSIIEKNTSIKQDIMYLSVQLQSVSAKVAEFRKTQNYRYFDAVLFAKILKRRKIKYTMHSNSIILNFKNIRIGSSNEGYVIYNRIDVEIGEWNSISGFTLEFNNFAYASYWNIQDVLLHPYLNVPYYIDIPYLDLSYEAYVDHIIRMVTGVDYRLGTGLANITDIMVSFNRYRRIWNGLKDPRNIVKVNNADIFRQEKNN